MYIYEAAHTAHTELTSLHVRRKYKQLLISLTAIFTPAEINSLYYTIANDGL